MSDQPVQVPTLEEFPPPVEDHSTDPPRPARPRRGPRKSQTQIASEVQQGKWGFPWKDAVAAAGFNADFIQELVQRGVGKQPN